MVSILLKPERLAQLEEYARRRGQDPAAALDELLYEYLDSEEQDYKYAVTGIRQGYADLQAARTQSAEEVFEGLREKYGLPL
jgi:predicted transcriptional regulator